MEKASASADAFCFSAHKIGGMKGFGGLVYKKEIENYNKIVIIKA